MTQATVKAAKPLEEMSSQELLELYNSLAHRPRTARFSTRSQAIAKIREYQAARGEGEAARDVHPAREATPRVTEAKAKVAKKTSAKPAAKDAPKAAKASAKTSAKKITTRPHKVSQSGRMMDQSIIRVLVDSNPRRKGTDAYSYFTKMMGSPTVEKYLHNFQDRRKARQWLGNTIRDGYVKLIG